MIDLTTLLNKREAKINFNFDLTSDMIEDCPELPFDISLDGQVNVSGTVFDNDKFLKLSATVSAKYNTVCDRCLTELSDEITFGFERYVAPASIDTEELGIDEEDILAVSEGGVDISRDVFEALCLELPIYHLCSEDCEGLCDVCGKPKNGGCTCKKEKEIDPRMESFQKILAKMD